VPRHDFEDIEVCASPGYFPCQRQQRNKLASKRARSLTGGASRSY